MSALSEEIDRLNKRGMWTLGISIAAIVAIGGPLVSLPILLTKIIGIAIIIPGFIGFIIGLVDIGMAADPG